MQKFIYTLLIGTGILASSCGKKNNEPSSSLVISSFTPVSAAKDEIVTITGTGFSPTEAGNSVSFNGKTAVVISAGPNQLTVKVPAGVQDGKITIHADSRSASSVNDFTYIWTVTTFAGDGQANFREGTGTGAEFNLPYGVTTDAAGNVYVADNGNNRIRKITPEGVTSTLAGNGMASYKDTIASEARFRDPLGVVADPDGNVFVSDVNNKRIRKISRDGIVSTVAGDGTTAFKDATGIAAEFYTPIGIARDLSGNLYIADANNRRIRKIAPDGAVTTLAGDGNVNFKDGIGAAAEFKFPTGVAADAAGNVYVADSYDNRIRKISPAGVVSTLAGDGHSGFTDAAGALAEFNTPGGVAVDASGNVYVADTYNQAIRRISPAGIVRTLAGGGTIGFKDGKAGVAEFNEPIGVAVDASGNIYVTDNGDHRIRKLE
jgi:sugar lactone lactonase YvrE